MKKGFISIWCLALLAVANLTWAAPGYQPPASGTAAHGTLWGAYATLAGPTQARTYTFPDFAATMAYNGAAPTFQGVTTTTTLDSELATALTAGNWTVGAGWESPIVGPGLIKSGDGVGTQTPSAATSIVAGRTYKVVITVSALSVGSAIYQIGDTVGSVLSSATTYTDYLTADTTAKLIITPTNSSRFTISAISIKELIVGSGDATIDGKFIIKSPFSYGGKLFNPNGHLYCTDTITALGHNAGSGLTATTGYNSFIGSGAGMFHQSGQWNTVVGGDSFRANLTGSSNSALGVDSLQMNLGSDNTAVGYLGGQHYTGNNLTTMGSHAAESLTTGTYNTAFGYVALQHATTAIKNSAFGYGAMAAATMTTTDADENCAFGYNALNNVTGFGNVAVGAAAGQSVGGGVRNTIIGAEAGPSLTGNFCTLVGQGAGNNLTSGGYNTAIGYGAGQPTNATISGFIAIGSGANPVGANTGVIGGNTSTGKITDLYVGSGVTMVSPTGITLHASGGSGADNPGGPLVLAGGQGTGTGIGGNVQVKTANPAAGTGSTLNTLTDKKIIVAAPKATTTTTATSLFDIALPNNSMIGGRLKYTVTATDATDFQSTSGYATWSAVAKAAVMTTAAVDATPSTAHSTGTLIVATTAVAGTGKITLKVAGTSSLTTPTMQIWYELENDTGTAVTIN